MIRGFCKTTAAFQVVVLRKIHVIRVSRIRIFGGMEFSLEKVSFEHCSLFSVVKHSGVC